MVNLESINKVNWNGLSCFERALCLASLKYQKSSLFAFLLLKIQYRDLFSDETKYSISPDYYSHKILKFLNLDYEMVVIDDCQLFDSVKKDIDSGCSVILNTNTFNIKETKDYQRKNHPHYTLIDKIYDGRVDIIDEDWTKDYWKKTNAQNGVVYLKKTYSFDEIKEQCSNYDDDNNKVSYLKVFTLNKEIVSIKQVLEEFIEGIKLILKSDYYFNHPKHAIKEFYQNFADYIDAKDSNKEMTEFEMKNKYIYPGVLDKIGCHHFSIDSQFQAFVLMDEQGFKDSVLYRQYQQVLEKYELIKLFVAKDLYDLTPKHQPYLPKAIVDVLNEERKLYSMLLDWLPELVCDRGERK